MRCEYHNTEPGKGLLVEFTPEETQAILESKDSYLDYKLPWKKRDLVKMVERAILGLDPEPEEAEVPDAAEVR